MFWTRNFIGQEKSQFYLLLSGYLALTNAFDNEHLYSVKLTKKKTATPFTCLKRIHIQQRIGLTFLGSRATRNTLFYNQFTRTWHQRIYWINVWAANTLKLLFYQGISQKLIKYLRSIRNIELIFRINWPK